MGSAIVPNVVKLPKGKIVAQKGNTFYIQPASRRKKYKLSKKTREKIARAHRRFKLPVLTVGAQAGWALPAANSLKGLGDAFNGDEVAQRRIANRFISPFTGVVFEANWTPKWQPREMLKGLVPNLIVQSVKKFGVFRGVNRTLAQNRIPLRLS